MNFPVPTFVKVSVRLISRRTALIACVFFVLCITTAYSLGVSAESIRGLFASALTSGTIQPGTSRELAPGSTLAESVEPRLLTVDTTLGTGRRGHTATLLESGGVLITGGNADGSSEVYDPATDVSSSTGNMNAARSGHTASRLSDGRVLITGGTVGSSAVASTEIYDPSNGTFGSGPAMTGARSGHTATVLSNGSVLIAGGGSDTAEVFDGASFTAVAAPMVTQRTNASAVLMADGRVFIAGGTGSNTAEIYNPADGTFTAAGNAMTLERSRAHLRVLPDGKVQIIGGNNDGSMEIYDPAIDTIGAYAHVVPGTDTCASLPAGVKASQTRAALFYNGSADPVFDRSGHTITEVAGNKAVVIGGTDNAGNTLDAVTVFNSSPATITTDKLDYAPGETVTFSGTGFQPGETVRVVIHEDPKPADHIERTFEAIADASGNFSGSYQVESHDAGVNFVVAAKGLVSGFAAQTSFTDGNVKVRTNATGITFTLTVREYSGNQICSGSFTTNTEPGVGFPNNSQYSDGVPAANSVEFIAAELSDQGGSFTGWTGETSGDTFNPVGYTPPNSRSICIPGDFTGTRGYIANYSTATATTLTVNAATGTYGGTVNLSATLKQTSNNANLSGKVIDFTLNGNSVGSATTNGSGVATLNNASLVGINAGTYATGVAASFAGDSSFAASNATNTLTVNKKTLTVTADNKTITYGAADPTFTFQYSGGFVGTDTAAVIDTPPTCTVSGAHSDVGTYPITCSGGSDNNYDFTYVAGTLTVNKASLTVTASSHTVTYGDAAPAVTPAYSGFVSGDDATDLTTAPTCTTTYATGSAVGSYPTSCSGGVSNNYTFNYVDGSVTVDKANLTVTADNKSREYGDANPAFTATISGFVNGENLASSGVTGTADCTSSATATSAASPPAYAINCTQGTLAAGNYEFATFTPGELTITKAHLTVTADNASREYGDANPAFTYVIGGFKNGETLATSGVTGAADCTSAATATSNASPPTYLISCSLGTLAAANYDFPAANFVNGELTITKATLTVNAVAASKVYGDLDPSSFGYTLTGFKNGETNSVVTGTAACTRTAGETVAGSPYTITCDGTGLTATNYNFAAGAAAAFTITPRPASVTPDAASKTYGAVDPAFTGTLTGFLAADNVTAVYSRTAGEDVAGSPYTISAVLSPAGVLDNYNITYNTAAFTINKATPVVTVSFGTSPITYDGFGHPATATVTGVSGPLTIPGDGDVQISYTNGGNPFAGTPTNAATYHASASFTSANPNYNNAVSTVEAELIINKANAVITVNGFTGTYDGQAHGATGTATGVNNVDLSANLSLGATFTNVPGGTANWTFTGGQNYNDANGSVEIVINKADTTTTVTCPVAVTYNGSAQEPCSAGVTGPVGLNEALTVSYSNNVNAGTATASASYAGSTNYNPSSDDATFTIEKANAVIDVQGFTGTYDGQPHGATGTAKGVLNEVLSGLDLGASFTDVPGGTATWTFTDVTGNYNNATGTVQITINKAPVTATAGSGSATYDGTAKSPDACVVAGPFTGSLICANNPASVGPDAGTYPVNPSVSGDNLNNFDVTSVAGSYVINKAATTTVVTFEPGPYVFRGSQYTATAQVTGNSGPLNELLTVNYAGDCLNVTVANGCTASAAYAESTNYLGSSDSKSITITPAPVTATAGSGSATYNGQTHSVPACALTGNYTTGLTCTNDPAAVGPGANTYTIAPNVSGANLNNFAITPVDGTFTINKANAVISVTPYHVTYDGQPHTATGTATGGGGENLNGLLDLSATIHTNAGTYNGDPWTFAGDSNHNPANGTVDNKIDKAPVTATAGGGSGTYNGSAYTPSDCVISGPGFTGNLDCDNNPATAGPDAGTYPTSPVVSGSGQENFDITLVNGSFVINQAEPLVNVAGVTVTYDGQPHGAIGTALGVNNEDLSSGLDFGAAYTDVPGGTANWAFEGGTNYLDKSGSVEIVINKAPVTATAGGGSATYDGNTKTPSSCVITGPGYTGDLTCVNDQPTVGPAANTYTINPVVNGTGLGNFEINEVQGTYTINKADVTATAGSGTGVYNGLQHSPSACIVSGAYIGSLSCVNNPASVGPLPTSYTIMPVTSGPDLANFNVTAVNGTYVITNDPVSAVTVSSATINENGTASVTITFADSDASQGHTGSIDWGDGSGSTPLTPIPAGTYSVTVTKQFLDDSPSVTPFDIYNVSVTISDGASSANGSGTVRVNNVAPVIVNSSGPPAPVALGTSVTVSTNFTDVGTQDSHTCLVDWDDNGATSAGTITQGSGSGSCSASRIFTSPGVYLVTLTITDDDTGAVVANIPGDYVVVYDPNGGFVTGGGWIDSPAGASLEFPAAVGKANFGFVSKYKKGTHVPEGQTEFQFKAGNLNFHSSAYDEGSLVVQGFKAQYKGTGTVNGQPGYKFVLTAYDGQVSGGGGIDKFRIKITRISDNAVIYDNRRNVSDDIDNADPLAISGGSIVIHSKGK